MPGQEPRVQTVAGGSRYHKLPPGPTGRSREEVATDQRARLHAATIDVIASKGYATATVADLIALAGVSRSTFYEHFTSKEACLLASFDVITHDATERIMAAYGSEGDGAKRIRAAYEAFVAAMVEDPKAARLAIVDVLALGPAMLDRVESMRLTFEQTILGGSRQLLEGVTLPPTVIKGVLAGFWQVARRRLLGEDLHEMQGIGGELLMWAISYNTPLADQLQSTPHPRRPESAYAPPDPRTEDDYMRMARAAAQLVAEHGYAQLTPASIIDEADVSYETFFEKYQSAERCFLAALQLLAAEALTAMFRATKDAENWADGVRMGIEAWLCHAAGNPTFAKVMFVEVFASGLSGISLREQMLERIAELLARHAPGPHKPSAVVTEGIIGAAWGVAYDRVVRGEARRLPELTEYATYLALAPVIGAEQAVEKILAAR